jgi:hypothetical protein
MTVMLELNQSAIELMERVSVIALAHGMTFEDTMLIHGLLVESSGASGGQEQSELNLFTQYGGSIKPYDPETYSGPLKPQRKLGERVEIVKQRGRYTIGVIDCIGEQDGFFYYSVLYKYRRNSVGGFEVPSSIPNEWLPEAVIWSVDAAIDLLGRVNHGA